ncbi:glycosyltransferase [Propylenella binzhouense]|uniref:Glycosyltransferase n=1 Tax=Propylenella binzhouense TaxID=2555902 RepID=A0A964WSK2_9HYPH|nr:glycosyltransferase [Propylenella binzhouense]MYZ47059.1 glycosyltransferase [Propylenella binzhouense]
MKKPAGISQSLQGLVRGLGGAPEAEGRSQGETGAPNGAPAARRPLPRPAAGPAADLPRQIIVFDEQFYLERNGDVRASVESGTRTALDHFLAYGHSEGRAPNPHFLREYRGEIERVLVFQDTVFVSGWLEVPLREARSATLRFGPHSINIGESAFQYRRPDVCAAIGAPEHAKLGFAVLTRIELDPPVSTEFTLRADGFGRILRPQYIQKAGDFLDDILKYLSYFSTVEGGLSGLYRIPPSFVAVLQSLFRTFVAESANPGKSITSSPAPKGRDCAVIFVQCGPLPLLPAIFHYLRSARHRMEVIVANNSRDYRAAALGVLNELETLYEIPWRYIEFDRNLGFSHACNVAALATDAEHLVFHNNDVFTDEPADYDKVVDALIAQPTGVVGVRQRFPSGGIMHDGLRVGRLDPVVTGGLDGVLSGISDGRGAPPGEVAGPVFTSGSFLALRRDLFQSAGGFSGDYLFGHFEDLDLCLRLAEQGSATTILKDVAFIHCEGSGSAVPEHITRTVPVINRMIFTRRWQERTAPWFAGDDAHG